MRSLFGDSYEQYTYTMLESLGKVEKHLAGKHDQSTHGRKRKGAGAGVKGDEGITYKTKGITVIDTDTPKSDSMLRLLRADDGSPEIDNIAKEIFEVTLETPQGTVTVAVTRTEIYQDEAGTVIGVSGRVKLNGVRVGAFDREIRAGDGEVYNSTFMLDESVQGSGIGTTIMAHWEDQYARAGVSKMTVTAITNTEDGFNGAYTWARYGYSISRTSAVNLMSQYLDYQQQKTGAELLSGGARYERVKTLARKYGDKPLLSALAELPDFADFLKGADGRVVWAGSKVPQEISVGKSQRSLIEIVNRWMRTKPAELENDDPRFMAEIREAIGSD